MYTETQAAAFVSAPYWYVGPEPERSEECARRLINEYGSHEAERLALGYTKRTVWLPDGGTAQEDSKDAGEWLEVVGHIERITESEGIVAHRAFGPDYPRELGGPAVSKFRRKAARAGGVSAMDKAERHAYGAAVEKAILAKQRSELQRELPGHACNCASGTWHTTGAEIHAAIQRQHRSALQASAAADRKNRPDNEWSRLYSEAMEEKRNRLLTSKKASADCTPRAADSAAPAAQRGKPKNGAAKMSTRSKNYPVKSNAARAAAQYGLTRGNLIEFSNTETGEKGFYFMIPDGVTPVPQKKKAKADKPGVESNAEPEKPKAEPKAKAAKKAKPTKKAKPAKPAKAKAKAKPASAKKYAPKTGKTAAFIAECKKGWVSADDAMKRNDWNSNTLRGVLGNYKISQKKAGEPIEFLRKREDGATFYRIVSKAVADKMA